MRLADAQMAIPDILLAILMVAVLGGSAVNPDRGARRLALDGLRPHRLRPDPHPAGAALRRGRRAVRRLPPLHHPPPHPAAGDAGADPSSPPCRWRRWCCRKPRCPTWGSARGPHRPPGATCWRKAAAAVRRPPGSPTARASRSSCSSGASTWSAAACASTATRAPLR